MILTIILFIILVPLAISLSTFVARFLSMLIMFLAIGAGSLVHWLITRKTSAEWEAPPWLVVAQFVIVQGFVSSAAAYVMGTFLKWQWVMSVGAWLSRISTTFLLIDILVLMVLASIHGYFQLLGEN